MLVTGTESSPKSVTSSISYPGNSLSRRLLVFQTRCLLCVPPRGLNSRGPVFDWLVVSPKTSEPVGPNAMSCTWVSRSAGTTCTFRILGDRSVRIWKNSASERTPCARVGSIPSFQSSLFHHLEVSRDYASFLPHRALSAPGRIRAEEEVYPAVRVNERLPETNGWTR